MEIGRSHSGGSYAGHPVVVSKSGLLRQISGQVVQPVDITSSDKRRQKRTNLGHRSFSLKCVTWALPDCSGVT
jgi:hypothetical protein